MGWRFLICLAKEMQHIIFYTYVHACIVQAILMRNKRYCSRFRNSVSLACWS